MKKKSAAIFFGMSYVCYGVISYFYKFRVQLFGIITFTLSYLFKNQETMLISYDYETVAT